MSSAIDYVVMGSDNKNTQNGRFTIAFCVVYKESVWADCFPTIKFTN